MKASEFLKCYKALVHLYNAILTDDAYKILKKYYPTLLKKELYADLKNRVNKMTKFYAVYKTDDHNYLICDNFMDFEDVDYLFSEQKGKDYYIPDTLEEFLLYADPIYVEENEAFKLMETYFIEVFGFEELEANVFTKIIVARIQNGIHLQENIDDIENSYEFKNDEMIEFVRIYQALNNNTRMAVNRGHTPLELIQNSKEDKYVS